MTAGTIEVVSVEQLEELFDKEPVCDCNGTAGYPKPCLLPVVIMIKINCDCTSNARTAFLCEFHQDMLQGNRMRFRCTFCGVTDFTWKAAG